MQSLKAGDPRFLLFTGENPEAQLRFVIKFPAFLLKFTDSSSPDIGVNKQQVQNKTSKCSTPGSARCATAIRKCNVRSKSKKYGCPQIYLMQPPSYLPSQRRCRDIGRELNELKATRDSLQTEVNDNVPAETSGLEEALRVSDLPIRSRALKHWGSSGLGHDERKGHRHRTV
jgi:hypothetical protein